MSTLRDGAIATLSRVISELDGYVVIRRRNDERAATLIGTVKSHVVALRDHYTSDVSEPLPPLAAEELRELSDFMAKLGEESGNEHARSDLKHVAGLIDVFITSNNIAIISDSRYRFDRD
jgi:hypothetical protein